MGGSSLQSSQRRVTSTPPATGGAETERVWPRFPPQLPTEHEPHRVRDQSRLKLGRALRCASNGILAEHGAADLAEELIAVAAGGSTEGAAPSPRSFHRVEELFLDDRARTQVQAQARRGEELCTPGARQPKPLTT